ncbi:hypothetical protein L1785_12115 [Antribacter sp. KLBMP9083]|uniref:Uncharacterized protein n=1 Tax=Antribacter soli TaxID=2910976 RepID=A0AA41QE19_9MICO|nr:hypothetical protein [Antribacter soli]MCF4121728.1 hypothetical protein [Antribacter soli]
MTHETGSVAARLSGRRLATVMYFPLGYEGDDGTCDIEDWDYEIGHVPTVGLALRTTDGAEFFIGWEQAEWEFGVALWEGPPLLIPSALDAAVTVEDHPHWRPLIGVPFDVEVGPRLRGHSEPHAFIRLRTAEQVVTITAAELSYENATPRVTLGMDAVMVFFGPDAPFDRA